jgi:hypothetical protein
MLPALGIASLIAVALVYSRREPVISPPRIVRGTLVVSQVPADGLIFVDGAVKSAPIELDSGQHDVRLTASGVAVMDTSVRVMGGSTTTIAFPIPRATPPDARATPPDEGQKTGTLAVERLPTGGSIIVDNQRKSGKRIVLDTGSHTVRLQARGYTTVTSKVQIVAGETRTLTFTGARVEEAAPVGEGVLMLRVNPLARVLVDGVVHGNRENYVVKTLSAGTHTLKFETEGYLTFDTTVIVLRGDTLKRSFTLKPRP